MRYVFGFLCVCALGAMPLVGCSEAAQCLNDKDCDDQNDCTEDTCDVGSGTCSHTPSADGTSCDFGGAPGLCMSGACEEDLCEGVECNDDNDCTEDACDPADGTCSNRPVEDDTACDFSGFPGLCKAGVCEDAMLCEGVECNDDNECTEDACDPTDGMCDFTPKPYGTPCNDGMSTCQLGSCGVCTNEADAMVYDCLEFTDSSGQQHTGTDASLAISYECALGSDSSIPPIVGCRQEAAALIACFPLCPAQTIQAFADCIRDCVQDTTAELCPPGLSDACVDCSGAEAACGAAFCTQQCGPDPTTQMCIACRCDHNCIQNFAACSGIPSNECN